MNTITISGRVVGEIKDGTSTKNIRWARAKFRNEHPDPAKSKEYAEITVLAFGHAARVLAESAGQEVLVVGRMRSEAFTTKSGIAAQSTQLVAENVFVDVPSRGETHHDGREPVPAAAPRGVPVYAAPSDDEPPF